MADVEIKPRDSGPYRVEGPIKLVDVDGDEWQIDEEVIALCRCGHSKNKPFCDGAHKEAGFEEVTRVSG